MGAGGGDGALVFAAVVVTFACFLVVGGAICVLGVALGSCGAPAEDVEEGEEDPPFRRVGGWRWGRPAELALGAEQKTAERGAPEPSAGGGGRTPRDEFWGRPVVGRPEIPYV